MPLSTAFLHSAGSCPLLPQEGAMNRQCQLSDFVPDALGEDEYSEQGQSTALQRQKPARAASLWAI